MGFDTPRLLVQVKSSDSAAGVNILRELQGVMKNFGAQQGLLVSWGGFNGKTREEARRNYFDIRLWDAGNLVAEIQKHYENLPGEIQAELPLKRIWALVLEE
jgi:restriction system protein